ncbi:hypothetical protein [Geobacter sp. SVR]|uniref:hypothetical protein n=1 Tax=Geobacter sp. SVR TaxID=2495594 RepID=UPI00143F0249|nr:hypothetical protein [Geobacter sp. SVR]BCS54533.1 hypothetical protein GSVR_28410 [Geobacter sp. SVR]GCF87133.1 hypothetical protein GSbR_37330 [Geobacter sp. SVR]
MPPAQRKIAAELAPHGLTVLLTRDYNSILLQLARLAQFERLVVNLAEADQSGRVADCIKCVRVLQTAPHVAPGEDVRPMEVLDIPHIVTDVHRELHARLDRKTHISPERLHAATAAFVGILSAGE